MIIRKYVVNDMKEALIRAKYELGKEAIIISQNQVKIGKWYQPFKKKMLEVTIAIEDEILEKNTAVKETVEASYNKKKKERALQTKEEKKDIFGPFEEIREGWEKYCQRNLIEHGAIKKGELKNFVSEEFIDNSFTKDLSLSGVNVFLGPTGVGKTTTIAKIAAREHLNNNKKVGLLTIDTYRIAAVEQLKTYARILGVPCETAKNPSDIKKRMEKLRYCDLILVDTLGASPKNEDRIEDIKEFLNEIEEENNRYLVVSMSSDTDTNSSIFQKYRELDYEGLILTKFDEVRNFSNFWSIMKNNVLPVQYYCFGQEVPDDMDESSLEGVLDYLWDEVAYG